MKKILLLMALTIILTSCNVYKFLAIKSFTDPKFKGKQYYRICILADGMNHIERDDFEKAMVEIFNENGYHAVAAIEVMPPTRKWSDREIRKFLKNNKFDGLLVVTKIPIESRKKSSGSSYYEISGDYQQMTNLEYIKKARSMSIEMSEGEFVRGTTAVLFDVKENELAWLSSSVPTRNIYIRLDIDDYTEELVNQLELDRIISKKEKE
jgi:hypothetical protein